MKVIISPAKKLDFETECTFPEKTTPTFLKKTENLAKELKKLDQNDISKLMKLSPTLSDLNHKRFQNFSLPKNETWGKQAVYAFNGDTYTGLDINSFDKNDVKRAQKDIRILSGLYGILKPLDLIQPYRLEMGTRFKVDKCKNLYEYWSKEITEALKIEIKTNEALVNCASKEYFDVIDQKQLERTIVTPVFKELKNGEYKIISFNAKRARGAMAKYIIKNKLTEPEQIKNFAEDNYKFNKKLSNNTEYVFTR